jgi:hypothetical protein
VKVEQGLHTIPTRPIDSECAEAEGSVSGSNSGGVPLETTTTSRAESTLTAPTPSVSSRKEPDYWTDSSESTPAGAQILGVAILEFGILFHSVCSPLSPNILQILITR